MYAALQVSFLLLCVSFEFAIGLNENISYINVYHIFSSDYVTSEPDNVLKNTVQWINDNTSFITGKKLLLNSMDTCYQDSVEELSSLILSQSIAVIIDGTCPAGSKLVEDISQRSDNTLYIRYPPFSVDNRQQSYSNSSVNMYPSTNVFGSYLVELVTHFGWSNVGIINELELINEQITEDLQFRKIFVDYETMGVANTDIFDEETIIYIILSQPPVLADIICKAYKQGLGYPNEMFIIPYWFGLEWIRENSTCSENQLLTVLDNTLAVNLEPPATQIIDKNVMTLAVQTNAQTTLSNYSIDSVWAVVNVLNETLTHDWEMSTNVLQDHLSELNIPGLTGQIYFDENGTRPTAQMGVYQFRDREYIRVLSISDDGLMFENSSGIVESVTTILPADVQTGWLLSDGIVKHLPLHIAVIVIFNIIAVLGIILATLCLIFNLVFRNKKILKLSSANLNFLIIIGAFWFYIIAFVIVNKNLSDDSSTYNVFCSILFTSSFSLSLCDGTIQGKMFRIFYIFYNPSPKKKRITDKHIFGYVVVLLIIDFIIFVIITSYAPLRSIRISLPSSRDVETNDLGVNTTFSIYICRTTDDTKEFLIHTALVYGFRIILNTVSLTLAIMSCFRIKHKVVNDAKSVMAIIFVDTFVGIISSTGTLLFSKDINIIISLACLTLIAIPTNILVLTFFPKMVAIYKDPEAKSIFSLNFTSHSDRLKSSLSNKNEK